MEFIGLDTTGMKGLVGPARGSRGEAACRWDPSVTGFPNEFASMTFAGSVFNLYLLTSNHMKVTEKVASLCSRYNVDIGW
jgi:hypothetical protein